MWVVEIKDADLEQSGRSRLKDGFWVPHQVNTVYGAAAGTAWAPFEYTGPQICQIYAFTVLQGLIWCTLTINCQKTFFQTRGKKKHVFL